MVQVTLRPLALAPRAVIFLAIVLIAALTLGSVAHSGQEHASADPARIPAGPPPKVGERFDFHGRWFAFPVGYGWIEVKDIVTVDGRQAYQIEIQGHSNKVLSKFYQIHDTVQSYLDVETLRPLRFEKDQREGDYRSSEVVTFDYERSVATYRSRLSDTVKHIELPEVFHDLVSVLYWLRSQPLEAGKALTMDIYSDEKIYKTEFQISGLTTLELLKRGTFRCVIVEPKTSLKGLLVKRGRLWAYITADENRVPLFVKVTTPWGPMSMVVSEASLLHAIGGAAGP